LPDEVFAEPYVPPVSDGTGQDRAQLRKAAQLLKDAGCNVVSGKRVLPNGEPITVEFLIDEQAFEPHHMPFIKNLSVLGIEATLRVVDPVQYQARRDGFDFDVTIERFSFSATPGDSLRSYFSSEAAALKGSNNLAGIANPAVDALIDAIISAPARPDLVTACRALDRVIRAGRYWIPQWYKPSHWIAYWDEFGRPAAQPRYFLGIPDTWWYEANKAAKLQRPG
jgi:microcin C transport system substrate-binding protein